LGDGAIMAQHVDMVFDLGDDEGAILTRRHSGVTH
jgi:hypothetical protein